MTTTINLVTGGHPVEVTTTEDMANGAVSKSVETVAPGVPGRFFYISQGRSVTFRELADDQAASTTGQEG